LSRCLSWKAVAHEITGVSRPVRRHRFLSAPRKTEIFVAPLRSTVATSSGGRVPGRLLAEQGLDEVVVVLVQARGRDVGVGAYSSTSHSGVLIA
jgi:hypothetical protein